jgi:hypothetical protein
MNRRQPLMMVPRDRIAVYTPHARALASQQQECQHLQVVCIACVPGGSSNQPAAAGAATQSLAAAGAAALRPQLHRAASKGLPSVARVALKAAEDQKLALCTSLLREVRAWGAHALSLCCCVVCMCVCTRACAALHLHFVSVYVVVHARWGTAAVLLAARRLSPCYDSIESRHPCTRWSVGCALQRRNPRSSYAHCPWSVVLQQRPHSLG